MGVSGYRSATNYCTACVIVENESTLPLLQFLLYLLYKALRGLISNPLGPLAGPGIDALPGNPVRSQLLTKSRYIASLLLLVAALDGVGNVPYCIAFFPFWVKVFFLGRTAE